MLARKLPPTDKLICARYACCLLSKSTEVKCPVREASWEAFAAIRQKARQDASFGGCQTQLLREYHRWPPATMAAILIAASRVFPAGHECTEKLLRKVLWRVQHFISCLNVRELLSMLEVFAFRGIREHDPRRTDLFLAAIPQLQAQAAVLSLSEVRRAAALYKQLNIRNEPLFHALGQRLDELLEASLQRRRHDVDKLKSRAGPEEAAVMTFLGACGRLNILPPKAHQLLNVVGPSARARKDLPRLAALAQLAAKFGLGDAGEANQILIVVSAAFERAVPDAPMSKGYASQAVYGQLLMALVFDETECQMRDRALVASIHAVFADFGSAIAALDERLARQLQVAELACRVERPGVMQHLQLKGLTAFLEGVKQLDDASQPLPKCSSQQHLQVSGALRELGVKHSTEEKLQPYVADVRLARQQRLIEIDGPLHFVSNSTRYDMKSSLKHRLLTKQGWDVHHIAWNVWFSARPWTIPHVSLKDWPTHHHTRLTYVARLLRSPPPGKQLMEYSPLELRAAADVHNDLDKA
ncbi:unnamed protein product [Effrenium voratum]|nr:unnamed protein product [Effrenium voratum]